nr:MipA/OmpV family protein [Vibrio gallicus]
MKLLTSIAVSTMLVSGGASAGWSVGVGASYSPAVYKGTPSNRVVIPVIGYEGEHVYFRGFSAGYRIWKQRSPHNIVFKLAYDPRTLKPSDSDDAFVRQVDKRKSTALGGVSYQYMNRSLGMFELTLAGDMLGRSDGAYAETVYRIPFRGERWMLTPALGLAWNSSKLNNYLYGISDSEADRLNVDSFAPAGDTQVFVGLRGLYSITDNIRFVAGVRYTQLQGDLEHSPLLGSTHSTAANIGVVYAF